MMDITNVAFLIPIHPPKYHDIYNLVNRLKENNICMDCCLVFSSMSDYDRFTMKDAIKPIIITHELTTKSIITYKKFYGLKQLSQSKYDYIICCDSEIDIVPENFTSENINEKIRQIFDNKVIYAGSTGYRNITNTSANLFPDHHELLKSATNNFNLYLWWSDLPVYRRADLEPFFNMINYDNIVWDHFDHVIYQFYLVITDKFRIVNTSPITNINWSLERLNTKDENVLNNLLDIGCGFSWISKSMYNNAKEYMKEKKCFLIYHLDRS